MLNVTLLKQPVLKILKEAGWYNGRKVDISNWIEQLTNEGYKCFPYAVKILEELGGFDIRPGRVKLGKSHPAQFHFKAFGAGSGEFDRMEIFEPIAGESLFPLGEIYQWFLYVGESKKIYMGCYEELYLIGNNIEDFSNNVVLNLRKPIALNK